jgi:hypothetical protein
MTTTTPVRDAAPPATAQPRAHTAVRLGLGVSLLVTLLFVALAWPAVRSAPRDLPLGVVGPPPAVEQLTSVLDRQQPDGFDLRSYADAGALEQAVRDRDVYGGLVLDPAQPRAVTASAASPAVAQLVGQVSEGVAAALSEQAGRPVPVPVDDLVPASAEDPRSAGLAASALPLTVAGIAPAAALVLALRRRTGAQLLGLAVAVGLSSLAVASVLDLWLGTTAGHLLATATALAAGMSAIGLVVLGLGRLLGRAGIALGAALALLLGNPLSAVASAPELLPSGWGALGQLLPQGATVQLLRSLVWFDGAAAGGPALVLLAWAAAGAALLAVAALRRGAQPGMRSNGEE